MNTTVQKMFQHEIAPGTTGLPCRLHYAPAMESLAQHVIDRFNTIAFESFPLVYSAESQQQDIARHEAAAEKIANAFHPPAEKTGSVSVYLLDGQKLAAADPDSQNVLNALTASMVQDSKNTVIALLSPDHPAVQSDLNSAVFEALSPLVATTEARIVTSFEELKTVLTSMTQGTGDG